jgi:hypothetical protein
MDQLIPPEIRDVLNSDFFGFKVWHILVFFLLMPYPQFAIAALIVFPGIKDKISKGIKDGISRVSGAGNQVSSQGASQGTSATGGPNRREGQEAIGEQQLPQTTQDFSQASELPWTLGGRNNLSL